MKRWKPGNVSEQAELLRSVERCLRRADEMNLPLVAIALDEARIGLGGDAAQWSGRAEADPSA